MYVSEHTIEEVLDVVPKQLHFGNVRVRGDSLKLRCFKEHGTQCYLCGLKATHFTLYYHTKTRKLVVLKFVGVVILSIYIYISPFLFIFSYYFPFYGIIIFLSFYLKMVRKILIYKVMNEKSSTRFHPLFFLKLIFYILINLLINIIFLFEMIFYRKAYKRRKNLLI